MEAHDIGGGANLSAALIEIRETAPHPAARMVLFALAAMLAALIAWAAIGSLDIVAVAEGRLIPGSRLKVVQSAEAGVVKEIRVTEGSRVRAGEVLVRMDATYSEADRNALAADAANARLTLRRIDAQLAERPLTRQADDPPALFARILAEHAAETAARRGALGEARAALEHARHELAVAEQVRARLAAVLPLYAEQERAFARLAGQGYVSRILATDKARERIEKEQELRAQEAAVAAARSAADAGQERLRQVAAEYERRLQVERVEVGGRLDKLEQELAKQSRRGDLLVLRAPQDAIVKELATHTSGAVVAPGTVLMTLVPANDRLRAEVWVRNDDIGFVHPGQPVSLKLSAYPFQKYGTLGGRVAQVGADAQEARSASDAGAGLYRALVDLDATSLVQAEARYPLSPGMSLAAEIHLGRRTVLEYLLSPLGRTFAEAGRER
ncbi:MAG: HlyD family type I secretion periplasmic adaptor subunit [Rhodocyclaceae bacterium]